MDRSLWLIEYLEGDLDKQEREELRQELEQDPNLRKELEKLEGLYAAMEANTISEPSEELRSDFESLLLAEKKRASQKRKWITWASRSAAAVVFVAVGVWLGLSIGPDNQDEQLAGLQNEIKANRELILQSLSEPSASQRFIGVSASNNIVVPDEQVIHALVVVMNTDDNTNVRLAAVRALSRFSEKAIVRKSLIDAVITQSDPLVQVALIDILVNLKEKRIVPSLQQLIKSDTTMDAVKDEALWGVMKLS